MILLAILANVLKVIIFEGIFFCCCFSSEMHRVRVCVCVCVCVSVSVCVYNTLEMLLETRLTVNRS